MTVERKIYALSITVNTETEYISLCSGIHMRNKNINLEWLIILSIENTIVLRKRLVEFHILFLFYIHCQAPFFYVRAIFR